MPSAFRGQQRGRDWRREEREKLDQQYTEIKIRSVPSFLGVLPVLLLQQLSLGLGRGVMPTLYAEQLGAAAFALDGAALLLKGALAAAACPLIGALSDRWGRRPLLMLCIVGSALPALAVAVPSSLFDGGPPACLVRLLHLPPLPAGAVFDGYDAKPSMLLYLVLDALSGVFYATPALALAFVADLAAPAAVAAAQAARRATRHARHEAAAAAARAAREAGELDANERRAEAARAFRAVRPLLPARLTLVGALGVTMSAYGLAVAVGPFAGSALAQAAGSARAPFVAAAALSLANLLYVWRWLGESRELPHDAGEFSLLRGGEVWQRMNSLGPGGALAPLRRLLPPGLVRCACGLARAVRCLCCCGCGCCRWLYSRCGCCCCCRRCRGGGDGADGTDGRGYSEVDDATAEYAPLELRANRQLRLLVVLTLLFFTNAWGTAATLVLYTERSLGMGGVVEDEGVAGVGGVLTGARGSAADENEVVLAAMGLLIMLSQGLVVPRLASRLGARQIASSALLAALLHALLLGESNQPVVLFLSAPLMLFTHMLRPAVAGMAVAAAITGAAGAPAAPVRGSSDSEEGSDDGERGGGGGGGGGRSNGVAVGSFSWTGEALGLIHGAMSLAEALGPLLLGALLARWKDTPTPGRAFLVAGAALLLPALVLANMLAPPGLDDAYKSAVLGGGGGGGDDGAGASGGEEGAGKGTGAGDCENGEAEFADEAALAFRYGAAVEPSGALPSSPAPRRLDDGVSLWDEAELPLPTDIGGGLDGAGGGDPDDAWITGGYELGSPTKNYGGIVSDSVFGD